MGALKPMESNNQVLIVVLLVLLGRNRMGIHSLWVLASSFGFLRPSSGLRPSPKVARVVVAPKHPNLDSCPKAYLQLRLTTIPENPQTCQANLNLD